MAGSNGIGSLQHLLGTLDVEQTQRTGTSKAVAGIIPQGGATVQDQAKVSAAGGLVAQATTGSDVRADRVAELQKAIASGTYHVSAQDVAGKIVDGLLAGR